MKKLKRAAAVLTAAAITASCAAGCSNTDYAMTADDEKINAGVYINYLVNEISNQMYMMYYSGEITDMNTCPDKEIDGKSFKDYVKDTALENLKEFAVISDKFEEFGLTLSEEEQDEIDANVSSQWEQSGEYFEYQGISRKSLEKFYQTSYKRQAIFDYYYEEGGVQEVTNDDLTAFVNDNYIRMKLINIAKSADEDETAKKEEDEKNKALLDGYLEEADGMSFEEFDAIMDEYDEYTAAQEETAEDGTDLSIDGDISTELDDSSLTDDAAADASEEDTSSEENTSTEEDTSSEEDVSDDEEAAADTETDDSSAAEGTETEEEEDPYAHETVINYTNAIDTESSNYNEEYAKVLEAIHGAEFGKAGIYEDDNNYYLYMTADIAERTDYAEENRASLLQTFKGDEFDELIKSWIDAAKLTVNEKAIKRYTVDEIFERQQKYYSENAS